MMTQNAPGVTKANRRKMHLNKEESQSASYTVEKKPFKRFGSIEDSIAQYHFCYMNQIVACLREAFPEERSMWCVDRFYPDSMHGPLYMDTIIHEIMIKDCERKRNVFKDLGLKYLMIKDGITEAEVNNQLAEMVCPGPLQQQN